MDIVFSLAYLLSIHTTKAIDADERNDFVLFAVEATRYLRATDVDFAVIWLDCFESTDNDHHDNDESGYYGCEPFAVTVHALLLSSLVDFVPVCNLEQFEAALGLKVV